MLFSSSAYRKESEHEIHTTTCLTAVCCSQDLSPRVISYFSPTSNCIQSVSPSPVFSYATLMKSCLDYTSLDTLSISCSALEPESVYSRISKLPASASHSKHHIFERLQTQATTTAKAHSMKRILKLLKSLVDLLSFFSPLHEENRSVILTSPTNITASRKGMQISFPRKESHDRRTHSSAEFSISQIREIWKLDLLASSLLLHSDGNHLSTSILHDLAWYIYCGRHLTIFGSVSKASLWGSWTILIATSIFVIMEREK